MSSAPVFAHEVRGGETEPERQTTTVATDDSTTTELHRRGSAIADDMRKKHEGSAKAQSGEEHKKVCEAHKKGLTNKFSRITANSQKIKTHIDNTFTKAQAYQQTNNVTVANYADLTAAVETAKTAAADSITALKAVTPTLDCNNTSVASDVATFKAAAQDTREKLKAYRTSVKAVLKALHEAKAPTESTNGGTQ